MVCSQNLMFDKHLPHKRGTRLSHHKINHTERIFSICMQEIQGFIVSVGGPVHILVKVGIPSTANMEFGM